MSTRELAVNIVSKLSESELREFLNIFADDTLLAMAECDYYEEHPEETKTYTNFQELLAEIKEEMANE